MSDVTFEDVVELARQLSPVDKARLVEKLAADLSTNGDDEIQVRLQRFRAAARSIGEKLELLGWTEEDAESHIEAVRQELYEEQHGKRG